MRYTKLPTFLVVVFVVMGFLSGLAFGAAISREAGRSRCDDARALAELRASFIHTVDDEGVPAADLPMAEGISDTVIDQFLDCTHG